MYLLFTILVLNLVFVTISCTTSPPDQIEDQRVINETILKYGPPQNYKKLQLPGPEIASDGNKLSLPNKFLPNETKSFSLRIRTITEHFSYNGRYEETTLKKNGGVEIAASKGQFGEHFKRKSGGYYIRTIGYVLDENGYRQFLIDLSMARTSTREVIETPPLIVRGPPEETKVKITSTVLETLLGGNTIG